MSGTFPSNPSPDNVEIQSVQPTIVSYSASGKYQSRTVAAHTWELTMSFPQMTRDEMMPLFAFAMKQRGRAEAFQVVPPNTATPRGVATGTPLVNGAAAAGATSINVDGWTAGTTDIMKAGDVLKVSSHSKVYMVTDNADSSTVDELLLEDSVSDRLILEDSATDVLVLQDSQSATLNFQPPLIQAISHGETVTVTNVPFTVLFKNDIQEYKTAAPMISRYEIDLKEAIN